MFKSYRVNVGISLDGPGELNDVRWRGDIFKTRESTARTEAAIERLCRENIPPSIIITLHKNNATGDKLPILTDWVRYLDSMGVRWIRLHLLEIDMPEIRDKYALSADENIAALFCFADLEKHLLRVRFDLFDDMRQMLMGDDSKTTCIWNGCDPYTTRAVRGVEGQGERSNCGRTNKDGIDFIKGDRVGFERYLALYATAQEFGGCKDCRFFLMCKGNCPGTGFDGDWRNRSEHCDVWKALYSKIEAELKADGFEPLSLSERLLDYERAFLESWEAGRQISLTSLSKQLHPSHEPTKGSDLKVLMERLRTTIRAELQRERKPALQ